MFAKHSCLLSFSKIIRVFFIREIRLILVFPFPDAPEIEIDQSWIRTNAGIEAQVSCNVHSEPRAEVRTHTSISLLNCLEFIKNA